MTNARESGPTSDDRARKGGMYGRYLPCPGGEGELKLAPKPEPEKK